MIQYCNSMLYLLEDNIFMRQELAILHYTAHPTPLTHLGQFYICTYTDGSQGGELVSGGEAPVLTPSKYMHTYMSMCHQWQ